MKNSKKKGRVLLSLFAVILTVLSIFGITNLVNADDDNTPKHFKRLTSNDDGTYKLALDVTGASDPEHEVASDVNVVIVYDLSESMSHTATGTDGYTRGDLAEDVVHDFVSNLAGYQDSNRPENIQMALVTFSKTASTEENWTTELDDIIRKFDDNGKDGTTNFAYNGYGTNWEQGLFRANNLVTSLVNSGDDDPTFVIFVTDGAPTARNTDGNPSTSPTNQTAESLRQYYAAALPYAKAIQGRENTTLYGLYIYANSNEPDLLDDLMCNSFRADGEERAIGSGTSVEPNSNYYNAGNTAALEAAIDDIFHQVVQAMGITNVKISDGTTSAVKAKTKTVNLLRVDESSYQYWLSMEVNLENGKYVNNDLGYKITFNKNSDETYTGSWTDDKGTHTIDGVIETDPNDKTLPEENRKKVFKMEWDGPNAFYDKAAPEASLVTDEDGSQSVDWDISSLGVLLNGVTYTVTFDAWPTQYTYDLIADLENGTVQYSDLSSSPSNTSEYAGLDQYISKDLEGKYFLRTNTEAELTYTDTREENPSPKTKGYENPDPVKTNVDEIGINKKWENDLDVEQGRAIKIIVNRDNGDEKEEFYDAQLDFNNQYKVDGIKIATGLMRLDEKEDGTGTIEVLESGHDYTFAELNPDYYKWELFAETVHPMLINGELKELILLDDAVTEIHKIGDEIDPKYIAPDEMNTNDYYNDGTNKYIKLDGKVYLVAKTTSPTIEAYNYRRSNLNIAKDVNGAADASEEFELNITVTDPGLSTGESLWFSVQENGEIIKDLSSMITSSGWTPEENGSGFYYGASGTTLTIKLKVGQNLRFTNLTTKATYEITESDKDGFIFTDANGSAVYGAGENEETLDYVKGTDYKVEKTGKKVTKVTGDITLTNSTYTVEVENTYESYSVDIVKKWDDHDDYDGLRDDIEIQVKQDGNNYGDPVTITEDSVNSEDSNEWDYTISKVTINGEETNLPRFKADGSEYTYSVTEADIDGYTTSEEEPVVGKGKVTYTFINTHIPKTEIKATKEWDDAGNQDGKRKAVTFKLYKKVNGSDVAVEGAEEKTIAADATGDALTVTWEDLDVFDTDNSEINYTVKEETALEGYETPEVTGNMTDGYTIKNSHKPEETKVTATKEWDDAGNQDGMRKAVTFKLYKKVNGEDVAVEGAEEKTIAADATGDALTVTWTGLAKNENGSAIMYTVKEETVLEGYDEPVVTETAKNEFNIKNSHTPEDTEIKATKEWDDAGNQDGMRKAVTFKLYKKVNGQDVAVEGAEEKTIAADATGDALTVTWTELDKYEGGSAINYTVKEETVLEGYDTPEVTGNMTDGFTIKNSHKPEETKVKATKEWDDAGNQDGKRKAVTFKLYKKVNGEDVAVEGAEEKTIAADATGDALTVTWTGLDKNENGSAINYTVKEETVLEGYDTPVITGNMTDGFTIKNSHTPEKTEIKATKEWDDANNIDGKRKAVTFKLYKKVNGQDVAIEGAEEKTIAADATGDALTVTWTGLDKCEGGSEINYTVKEETILAGYKTPEVTGNKETGFTIKNSYEPGSTNIKITKEWKDVSADGITNIYGHNDEIKVQLSCKSSKADYCTNKKYTLNEGNDWTVTEDGLPKYRDGELLTYDVTEETTVNNYESSKTEIETISDLDSENTFEVKITNTYKPNPISISGQKHWEDDDDNDVVRPSSITVNLYDGINEEAIQTKEVTADNDWKYEFTKLPETDNNGNKINYYVDEVIDGKVYTKELSEENFDITNYHLSETVTFTVIKHWDDEENFEGLRPRSITVKLLADGAVIKTAELNEGNEWTYVFDNDGNGYKKYKRVGNEKVAIDYTIEEEKNNYYNMTSELTEGDPEVIDVAINDNVTAPQTNTNNTYDITNHRDIEYITIQGEKIWNDQDDYDRIRPEFINVKLFANGIYQRSFVISKESGWKYILYGLLKYQNGEEIKYTIEEEPVEGYTTVIDGYNLTNTHEVVIEVFPPKTGGKTSTTHPLFTVIMIVNMLGAAVITAKNN
ncbi:MAG: Cna B-type domain-containing protein [Bacilli bacterium]|nr:Cna B-type domain-containing protein [Bacilli bacterium]